VHYHKPSASSTQGYPQHQHHPPSASSSPSVHAPPRVLTLDLKAKLASALGGQGKRYWDALLRFCTAKISRVEFESEARACLKSEDGE
jgi:transcriptional coactivator HFI1/ADA1